MAPFLHLPRQRFQLASLMVGLALLCTPNGARLAARPLERQSIAPANGVTIDDMLAVRDLYGLTISPDGEMLGVFETSLNASETAIVGRWLIFSATTGRLRASSPIYNAVINDVGLVDAEPQWSPNSATMAFRIGSATGPKLMMLDLNGRVDAVSIGAGEAVARFAYERDGHLIVESTGTAEDFRQAESRERALGVDVDTIDAAEPLFGNQYTGNTSTTVRYENSSTQRWSAQLGGKKRYWRWNSEAGGKLIASSFGELAFRKKEADNWSEYVLLNDGPAPNDLGMPPQLKRLGHIKEGTTTICREPFCRGRSIGILGIDRDSGAVIFTREGLSDTRGLYRWSPFGKVTSLIGEHGAVSASSRSGQQPCPLSRGAIYCIYSDPWTPPQIRMIRISDGSTSIVYSPTKAIEALQNLEIRQVHWKGPNPGPSSGVLVLPRRRTKALPLVISSYRCRGFLRGGVGFDALEYVLASKGFAVLCVTLSEESLADTRPLGIHRRFSEEITSGIKYLSDAGIVDFNRVGLSGRSLSAEAISFAITHGQNFAAASSVGSSIADPIWLKMYDLSDGAFFPIALKYHRLASDGSDASETSPAMSAMFARTPLIMQPPEKEFRGSLELYYALKKHKLPVEMIIYPDEEHQIVQPRHMQLNAERNIDWFMFWIMNREDNSADKNQQYAKWRRLRFLAK